LAANPSTHIDIAVSRAGTGRIYVQADAGGTLFAVATAPAGDVEWHRDQVAHFYELNVSPGFDDFSGDFVSQNQSFGRGSPAPDHVLVTATNVGGNYLENDAVFAFPISERQPGEVDALNFDDSRLYISYPAILRHGLSS
jgi:hypothetical protein